MVNTRYEILKAMRIFTKMSSDGTGFQKLIQTGQLGLWDYDTGFIDLLIYPYTNHKNEHYLRISFSTIDDGNFGVFKKVNSWEDARVLASIVANEVFKDMTAFPTKEELNKQLEKYSIAVDYEY